ncbi:uncharacterized protein A4U43_C03F4790 [Asparagus officinalis]|uniref:Uncharacterized protein n=1 Tax=Asparagus officinalis TaxID=4686 RepID=A0A5P1F7E1_ASPOF|nr:uncharacterized protein A4U43_C03F4790 [Asparagus officinalis]
MRKSPHQALDPRHRNRVYFNTYASNRPVTPLRPQENGREIELAIRFTCSLLHHAKSKLRLPNAPTHALRSAALSPGAQTPPTHGNADRIARLADPTRLWGQEVGLGGWGWFSTSQHRCGIVWSMRRSRLIGIGSSDASRSAGRVCLSGRTGVRHVVAPRRCRRRSCCAGLRGRT